ncbi:MAG: UDP-N-acetylmuramoyl-L-alanine--D-glutamate ligase [Candidatus Pacebacteria bacterium]|nr:UDP-N-acetylmuramoyl-L-alanine--D-glutamate ligase [Candidatus Paceibacterota bacterium]
MKFKGKKVLIAGLGLNKGGVSAARFFCSQGSLVTVTDLKNKEYLKESLNDLKKYKIKYTLGRHKIKDFLENDLIIKNPAIPNNSYYLNLARKKGIPVETDINLFFKLAKGYIIGVTGTKGKTTTCYLLYEFFKKNNVFLAGNLGISPLDFVLKLNSRSITILELSSFALENLNFSPNLAVITNIYPDHLNRYKNIKEYVKAKKRIFKFQKKEDLLVLNYDIPCLRNISAHYFSETNKKADCYLKNNKIFFKNKFICETNLLNSLPAVLSAKLLNVPNYRIKEAISGFKGVPNRQEFIAEKKGIKYINDTTATMPQAVQKAIQIFSPIILIAGGQDKGLDYKELSEDIKKNVKFLILLKGTATDKLKKYLKNYYIFSCMEKAVKKASLLAKKGDYVVLSPGAASFGLFKNEFDRGEQFKKAVKKI